MRKRTIPIRAIFNAGLLLASGLGALTAAPEDFSTIAERTFWEVWNVVNDSHYDPTFGGIDWRAEAEALSPRLAAVETNEALRELLGDLLARLGLSHFGILESGLSWMEDVKRSNGHSGIEIGWDDEANEVVITRIRTGFPAEGGGLRPGMALSAVGSTEVAELRESLAGSGLPETLQTYILLTIFQARLDGRNGEEVTVEVNTGGGEAQTLSFKARRDQRLGSQAFGNMPSLPMEFSRQTLGSEGQVVHLQFTPFVADQMAAIRESILGLNREEKRGLIIDLRGNPGGIGFMANGITGLLSTDMIELGHMQLREGTITFVGFPQAGAYLGPVAVLVNELSASTSELLAAGLQEAGRARVFGRRTAGAALPSYFRTLPSGDILQHAIANFTTVSGRSIEGEGVLPDEVIPASRELYAEGGDPILAAALVWLESME
jgi:carboxyl-terminal processing protease